MACWLHIQILQDESAPYEHQVAFAKQQVVIPDGWISSTSQKRFSFLLPTRKFVLEGHSNHQPIF